jgi:hypothetical protein
MARGFQQAILAIWISLLCLPVASQQPIPQPPPSPDPRQLAEAAMARYKAEAASKTRFTDFALIHTLNFNDTGKKTFDILELFEETWINNLPYNRLVEFNGKPLKGKQLRQEQERYDQAVANRQPLGDEERAHLLKLYPVYMDAEPQKALGPGYILREVRQEDSPHGLLHIIEAISNQPMFDKCRWRYLLSISDRTPTLFAFRADVDDQTHPSNMCKDSFGEASWELVDGIPKISHYHDHFFLMARQKRLTIDGEGTFTRYRRFTTQVTIGPATVIPSDAPPPTPKQ